MENRFLELADMYFSGPLLPRGDQGSIDPAIAAHARQFFLQYDDWYRDYYNRHDGNKNVESVKALVKLAIAAFHETYRHLDLCYVNCAISSGTNPHLDAVAAHYHTSDRLARVIGSEQHVWRNIYDNSFRALTRAHKIQPLLPELFIVTPPSFEGSTRVFHKGGSTKLTGGMPFDGADYMSFWNTAIDACTGFMLDDPIADAPSLERVMQEIAFAQGRSDQRPIRTPMITTDWANSRNSIFEMARGNYVRFGLHPLRPDARMDMRIYDEITGRLYPATLLDCFRPVVQNILRWTPQGIAASEACQTAARLIKLHRLRTDPALNARQDAPLDLKAIDPLIGNPRHDEVRDFDRLIEKFEPFLLNYCGHLIKPAGLPASYSAAGAATKAVKIGRESMLWQRGNIPAQTIADLWPLTLMPQRNPAASFRPRAPLHGVYLPQKRQHDFVSQPFQPQKDDIWPDRPFDDLDEMSQDLGRFLIGVLETGLAPLDSPEFHGLRFDMKRGAAAIAAADAEKVRNLNLLPGAMGRDFQAAVRTGNAMKAGSLLRSLRTTHYTDRDAGTIAFGTPVVALIRDAALKLRSQLAGPGPTAMSSAFGLALELEMMARNYTHVTFQKGWETSDDSARFMVQATKIQFGKIKRPGGNDNELQVLNEAGAAISFYDRYEALRLHLERLAVDPDIVALSRTGDAKALEDCGVRHASVAMARLIEIYDCLKDPLHNQNRFELQRIHQNSLPAFARDLDRMQAHKREAVQSILNHWVWLWTPADFQGLPQDYRDAWLQMRGRLKRHTGPPGTDDQAVMHRFGPN